MIVLQPVLEIYGPDGFALWPVAEFEQYGFLPLSGALSPAEVGTAVMRIADYNGIDPEDDSPPRPTDPLGSFLHGLLTMDDVLSPGGLRVTDTAIGITLVPGCCNGLEERHDWLEVLDSDGGGYFGHAPSPLVERLGDTVRLTVDAERDDSPVIELPVAELRQLISRRGARPGRIPWAGCRLGRTAPAQPRRLGRRRARPRLGPACAGRTVEAVGRRTSSDIQLTGGRHLDRTPGPRLRDRATAGRQETHAARLRGGRVHRAPSPSSTTLGPGKSTDHPGRGVQLSAVPLARSCSAASR